MIYLISIGLDEKDISLKALDAIKKCDEIYAEFYTNNFDKKKLEKIIARKIIVLEREKVESDFLIKESKKRNVGFLVSGDIFSATTHIELFLQAKKENVKIELVHGSSIFTAVAETGLQLYKFGRVTTLMKEKNYLPNSPYEVIDKNKKIGLHSLVLLDVFMNVKTGLEILKYLENKNKKSIIKNKIIVCSKLGRKGSKIIYDFISKIDGDFQIPSCIIIPGKLNFKEKEMLQLWKKNY